MIKYMIFHKTIHILLNGIRFNRVGNYSCYRFLLREDIYIFYRST